MVKNSDDFYSNDGQYGYEESQEQQKPSKRDKKIGQKKQKPIKKQNNKKKSSSHKYDISDKDQSLIEVQDNYVQQSQRGQQDIFQLSQFNENYVPRHQIKRQTPKKNKKRNDQPRSSSNNNESQDMRDQNFQNQDEIQDIRMKFVEFFNSIQQSNGLVFKKQFRKKLRKQCPQYKWTEQHDLDPEGQQVQKIKPVIQNLKIFNKHIHNVNMNDSQFLNYIKEDVQKMTQIFKQSSYIFCKQVTHQLYSILRKICDIVIEFRKPQEIGVMIQKLREFGNKIASYDDKDNLYYFFGYQFVKFPTGKSEKQYEQMYKKQRYKYGLRHQYRKPNTQFANFTQKLGKHLLGLMKELKCYESLR